jgi:predicted regulator of Ras-like GTPase activity (Roadblock/LC7/MglB family)
VSFDGLPMASALPPSMDEDRVAAMSAALLSLGTAPPRASAAGAVQVYIEGESGTVFLVSAQDEAVLVAVAVKGAKAGMMLYEVRAPPPPSLPCCSTTGRRGAGRRAGHAARRRPRPAAVPAQAPSYDDLPVLPAPPAHAAPAHTSPLHASPAHASPVPPSPVAAPPPHVTVVPTASPWTSSYASPSSSAPPSDGGLPSVMPSPPTAPAWT